ncbi:MAG: NCS2 family permease [Acidobacteriota bacterium]|nr:NCS2 family permease [Acidobacteriota bacterium]
MASNPSLAHGWLDRTFLLSQRRTSMAVEARAGLSTFLVMAYIIFVNPTILGDIPDSTGATLPSGAVLSITCLAAGVLSILMGLLSNYPFALAPGMGLNAVVSLHLVGQLQLTWVQAMTVVLLQGLIILVLVLTRFREAMMDAIPTPLKKAIGAGIGLFLAIIGFSNAGLISRGEGGAFSLGNPDDLGVVTFLFGFFLTLWLMSRKVQAALLWGILSATLLAIVLNSGFGNQQAFGGAATVPSSLVGIPQGLTGPEAIFGRWDWGFFPRLGLLSALLAVFSLMLTDFFDTMGTVVGLGEEGGFLQEDGRLPGVHRVLLVDSLGAVAGGLSNCSSNTTYIESAAGIAAGGRTGLTSVVVGLFFLLGMFFSPLAGIVPKQATAPSLILVGFLMMGVLQDISWRRLGEGVPAFLTLLLMPFTFSISNGIGAGIISYTFMKLASGKHRELHALMVGAAVAFAVYFVLSG